jgi:redox-sensitive bicupin YhaK (pirin superfamily)
VALPRSHEETEPSFVHAAASELPVEEGKGVVAKIIAGSFLGRPSPVPVLTDLFYMDVQLQRGVQLNILAEYGEQGIYVARASSIWAGKGCLKPASCWSSSQEKCTAFSGRPGCRAHAIGGRVNGPTANDRMELRGKLNREDRGNETRLENAEFSEDSWGDGVHSASGPPWQAGILLVTMQSWKIS